MSKGKRALLILLICIFTGSAMLGCWMLLDYDRRSNENNGEYDDLASIRNDLISSSSLSSSSSTSSSSASSGSSSSSQVETPLPEDPTILPELLPIYETNEDTVGWLIIPGTKVNYPVMQSPYNPDYYLKHNFNKVWSDWGAIYARETCNIFAPSDNITLYGHHMADGSMFAGLDAFKNEDFWREHQTFTFDTLYERHTYRIFAVFKISAADAGTVFPYHTFENFESEADFNAFLAQIMARRFYDTGITPVFGDKLLMLSTCEYTLNNGRFIVCAVRID